jgi:mannuronan synthase
MKTFSATEQDTRMDTGNRPSVVHETEAQRQHPRIRIPAQLRLDSERGGAVFRVHDISAGGFSFDADTHLLKLGKRLSGTLVFVIDGIDLGLRVSFEVRHQNSNGRTGCRFDALGAAETSALRQLIGAHLAGELATVGDVLATAARDSYVRPRAASLLPAQRRGVFERGRAVLLTTLIFLVGIIAFTYTASKLYTVIFVMQASAAKVAAPTFSIAMPRDGTFFNLVPADGIIHKGQPLGSFQAAMLDVVQNDPSALHLTPAQLSDLLGESLKGTLASPCDCKVLQHYALDSQYVNRNQPLMELIPLDAKPYVLARFHFEDLDRLQPGRTVALQINGAADSRYGTIRRVRLLQSATNAIDAGSATDLRGLNSAGAVSDVLVEIEPQHAIDPALLEQPVAVSIGEPRSLAFKGLSALMPGTFAQ